MECDLFLVAIKHLFRYLFDEFGFQEVHFQPYGRYDKGCLYGFESPICRLVFVHESGVDIRLGTRASQFGSEYEVNGQRQWWAIDPVLAIAKNTPFSPRSPWPPPEEQLAQLSAELEPICRQVLDMFKDRAAVAAWEARY